jgi:hypothetical protein
MGWTRVLDKSKQFLLHYFTSVTVVLDQYKPH